MSDDIDKALTPELEKLFNSCTNIPSLPAVALKIIDASKDPDISLHQVSSIISADPAISAKLLKIANSPLYSQRRTLNNLREALTLLGFNASLTIALSFSLLESLSSANKLGHENYWRRSILSASIARLLGIRLRVAKIEDLFLASLLQDIGVLVLQCVEDSPYSNDMELKHSDRIEKELEVLGIEHTLAGAWLLRSWNLPEYLVKSVMNSHALNVTDYKDNTSEIYFHYCLNLSGNLADIWLNENPSELMLSILDVTERVLEIDKDEFNELIVDIDNAIPEISNMFDIKLTETSNREKIVQEAKELLLQRSLHSIKKSEEDCRYISSITDRVEKIEKESRLDHLTKVYNRKYVEHLLEIEYEEANINHWPLSLAFIDIDEFKEINDTHGHLVGDEILTLISDFFIENIRETDVYARYGGDEFLLMLPGSTADIAKSVLERLLNIFKETIVLNLKGVNLKPSISIGLATHMDKHDFKNLKEFMAAADEALYSAKSKGKGCLVSY